MAAPSLDVDWNAIKDAAIAGVPIAKLAEIHQIDKFTIHKRAKRQAWSLPHIVQAAVQAQKGLSNYVQSPSKSGQIATQHAAETLAELGESGALTGAKLVHGLLKRAAANPDALFPLAAVGDVAVAIRALNAATGREKASASVTLNLGLLAGGSRGQVEVLDVSSESQESQE